MKKEHSVFIGLESHEVLDILHSAFRRKGWLKGIPKDAVASMFDEVDVAVEYNWEEKITQTTTL